MPSVSDQHLRNIKKRLRESDGSEPERQALAGNLLPGCAVRPKLLRGRGWKTIHLQGKKLFVKLLTSPLCGSYKVL